MSVSTVTESQTRLHLDDQTYQYAASRQHAPVAAPYATRKHLLDSIIAAVLLIPALPIIGLLLLLVRATSPGPPLFRQIRVGRNGATFKVLKIRTMRCDAEKAGGAQWSSGVSDPRVTRVGKVIRRLHLDEFPQLINVLRGEMALVGPRPERPEFVEVLSRTIPGYTRRHDVRPGITGLAQINLPPDTDLESACRKLDLDLQYIQQSRLSLDLRVIACTGLRLFGIRGNFLIWLTGVRREPTGTVGLPVLDAGIADRPMTPELIAQMAQSSCGSVPSPHSTNHACNGDGELVTASIAATKRKAR